MIYTYRCKHCSGEFHISIDPHLFGCVCDNCDTGERQRMRDMEDYEEERIQDHRQKRR